MLLRQSKKARQRSEEGDQITEQYLRMLRTMESKSAKAGWTKSKGIQYEARHFGNLIADQTVLFVEAEFIVAATPRS